MIRPELTIDDWRAVLAGVGDKSGGGFMARCPAHDDHNPSLSIDERDGKVLVKCHAGCEYKAVKAAAGLNGSAATNGSSYSRSRIKKKKGTVTATWEIRDADGELQATHVRYDSADGKECIWKSPDGSRGLKGRKLATMPLYGSEHIADLPAGSLVVVAEGEKATDALRGAGIAAVGTVTGASGTPGAGALEVLRGHRVVTWEDNDTQGADHMRRVAGGTEGIATEVRRFVWEGAPKKGDAADHPDLAAVKDSLEAAPAWTPSDDGDEEPEEDRERRIAEAWELCEDLAKRADITSEFADTLHARGVAGESNQIRIVYLTLVSRFLNKMVNVAVKGPSSSGKSYLVERVVDAFPESAYYALTSMSEKALIYLDEDMRHRFLIIYEASGMAGDMQTYLIRTLLSEGEIKYQTAEATSKGVRPRLLHLEGPTGLIVTTTQTRMHPENETRLFSLNMTDSRAQTADILLALADEDREPVSMDAWRALQTWLEGQTHEVSIPYAKTLAGMVPRSRSGSGAISSPCCN